jgi:hypothetical protein
VGKIFFMELSSDGVMEISPNYLPNDRAALVGFVPGSAGTELRSRRPASRRNSDFRELAGCWAHATAKGAGSSGHSELFSRIEEITSDQEGTEEILERTGMALFRRDNRFEHRCTDKGNQAMVWQRRQDCDWIDGSRNDLDAGKYRRSQIYGSVSLVEGSLGQVRPGYGGYTDCGAQEEENQCQTKSLHVAALQTITRLIPQAGVVNDDLEAKQALAGAEGGVGSGCRFPNWFAGPSLGVVTLSTFILSFSTRAAVRLSRVAGGQRFPAQQDRDFLP